MAEQEKQKDFIRKWVEAETEAHPECPIVKAISDYTKAEELDEAKLLADLKTMAKQESGEEA